MIMKETSISFRTDHQRIQKIAALAKHSGVSQSEIINDALDAYLAAHQRFVEHVSEGLREADAGEFVTESDVRELSGRWRTVFDTRTK